ncbi:MAG TPA: POTRA domain-containing protein [Pyrinomonadaceae bacterium]|jgi:outer membrane protein assembly factor BamA|nr:POTRA domain-containing protein [Pyrinomonadaceae bacterium]
MIVSSHYRPVAIHHRQRRVHLSPVLLFVLLVCAPCMLAQQGQSAKKMKLSKIEFSGLQTHTESELITASGLQIGQIVDIAALDEAAQRLLDSGLVKKLSYRYHTNGEQATVTFQLEEEKGAGVPVVLENFVWFSEEEIQNAIRQQVPAYDGTAPDSAVDGITRALQGLLRDRKIPGRVDYLPSANALGGDARHVFSIEGVKIPICTLHFSGATAIQESELMKHSQDLLGGDYRRTFVAAYARVKLIPIYREHGHLRAAFSAPWAKPESASDCQNGVTVTLPVEEGLPYTWDKAEWTGNAALSGPELSAALGMKTGEIANGLKIDKGLESLHDVYGHKGYLNARLKAVPDFSDSNGQVTYHVEITEGPQYHMGNFSVIGLSENLSRQLRNNWKLKPGDVYDALYLKEYLKQGIRLEAADMPPLHGKAFSEAKPDKEKLTVDVIITFKRGD